MIKLQLSSELFYELLKNSVKCFVIDDTKCFGRGTERISLMRLHFTTIIHWLAIDVTFIQFNRGSSLFKTSGILCR